MMLAEEHEDGFDAKFASSVPEYYKCPLCFFVLREPIQVMQCGHRFCRPCFKRVVQHSESVGELLCPIDRDIVNLQNVFEDKGMERMVGDLEVKCSYEHQGCEWIGELRYLDIHEKQCNHRYNRPIVQIYNENPIDELKGLCEQMKIYGEEILSKQNDVVHLNYLLEATKTKYESRVFELFSKKDDEKLKESEVIGKESRIKPPARRISLHHLKGHCNNVTVIPENYIEFHNGGWCTVGATSALLPTDVKCFFEVTIHEGNGNCKIGLVSNSTNGFVSSQKYGGSGCVIGVAIDTADGKVSYGRNGVWAQSSVLPCRNIFPAISGWWLPVFVNFGEHEFKYTPPDASYKSVLEVV